MKNLLITLTILALTLAALPLAGQDLDPPIEEPVPVENVLLGDGVKDLFLKGGPLMWPILLCSVVALAFILERFVTLRKNVIFPPSLRERVGECVSQGRLNEALTVCREDSSPFARIVFTCLGRAEAVGFEMEAALEEAGSRELYDLRKNGRPLGVIADVAPLLGLMGTVLGMIKAFEVVAKTGALGRTELLAEGIGEALITTAFGLSVAIPSMIAFQYFRGKAEGLLRIMEDECIEIVVSWRQWQRKNP